MTVFELNKDKEQFWLPMPVSVVIFSIEKEYKDKVIRDWYIEDLVVNKEEVLIKWAKRSSPLTQEEIRLKYR